MKKPKGKFAWTVTVGENMDIMWKSKFACYITSFSFNFWSGTNCCLKE